jgi:hypothetical protein
VVLLESLGTELLAFKTSSYYYSLLAVENCDSEQKDIEVLSFDNRSKRARLNI